MKPSPSSTASTVMYGTCPTCENPDLRRLRPPGHWIGERVFAGHGLGLTECKNCELVFVNPRPSEELLGEFYEGPDYRCHDENENHVTQGKADFVLGRVEAFTPPCKTFLDFGCGGGWLMRAAHRRGWEAYGYEVGAAGLDTCARLELPVTGNLDELPRGHFGAIVLNHVLEHLEEPHVTLDALGDLLAPGGRLFIMVPNARSLRAKLALPALCRFFGFDERYRAFPIHLSYFTRQSLTAILERTGWRVADFETAGLGVDELLIGRGWQKQAAYHSPMAREVDRLRRSVFSSAALRERVKRTLYGADLGENLLAVAVRARAA